MTVFAIEGIWKTYDRGKVIANFPSPGNVALANSFAFARNIATIEFRKDVLS